jgi:phosphate-selective porin OprO/OprP
LLATRLQYALGLFNGVPDGANADVDTDNGKDAAARLFFRPFAAAAERGDLGLGLAVSAGDQEGSVASPALPTYRTVSLLPFFSYRSDGTAAGTAIAHGDRTRVVPQGYFYRGRFGLLAEHAISRQEVRRDAARRALQHEASQLQVVWIVTGGRPSYRGPAVDQPYVPGVGGRGAVELAARVHRLLIDPDAFPLFASPSSVAEARSAALAINWTWSRNVRWMLHLEQTSFDGDREDEHVVLGRLQLVF